MLTESDASRSPSCHSWLLGESVDISLTGSFSASCLVRTVTVNRCEPTEVGGLPNGDINLADLVSRDFDPSQAPVSS